MKKQITLTLMLFLCLFSLAQNHVEKNRTTVEGKNIKVMYTPLNAKGKLMFGDKIPYGNVWTAGGKSTEISFVNDGTFGGLPVKAGTYTLFAIPGEKEWIIILNASIGLPADFQYEEIKDKDVLKVTVPIFKTDSQIDRLLYRFTEDHMILEWAHIQVAVPIGS